jgi:hypothetical protein
MIFKYQKSKNILGEYLYYKTERLDFNIESETYKRQQHNLVNRFDSFIKIISDEYQKQLFLLIEENYKNRAYVKSLKQWLKIFTTIKNILQHKLYYEFNLRSSYKIKYILLFYFLYSTNDNCIYYIPQHILNSSMLNSNMYRKCKFSKFILSELSKIFPEIKKLTHLDKICEFWNQTIFPGKEIIINGPAIKTVYKYIGFTKEFHLVSCLKNNPKNCLTLYTKNKTNVFLYTIKNNNNHYVQKAFLFKPDNNDGFWILDRVYTDCQHRYPGLNEKVFPVISQGKIYELTVDDVTYKINDCLKRQSINGIYCNRNDYELTLTLGSKKLEQNMPYMDIFKYIKQVSTNSITLSTNSFYNINKFDCLQSTECPSIRKLTYYDYVWSTYNERWISNQYSEWCEDVNAFISTTDCNFNRDEYHGLRLNSNLFKFLGKYYYIKNIVRSNIHDRLVPITCPDVAYSKYENDYVIICSSQIIFSQTVQDYVTIEHAKDLEKLSA